MKRFISLAAAAAMIFGAASCQKEPVFGQEGDTMVTFSVEIPAEITTKADMSDGTTVDELIVEAWSDGKRSQRWTFNVTSPGSKQFVAQLDLLKGMTYDILFWAQKKGTQYYDTNYWNGSGYQGLNYIVANYTTDKKMANDEARDAFYGSVKAFEVTGIATEKTVYLKRPFAQVNFGSSNSDWKAAQSFISKGGLKSGVVFSKVPTRFNVSTGDVVSGYMREVAFDISLSPASEKVYNNNVIKYDNTNYHWTSMNYVFAPADGSVIESVTASFIHDKNEGEPITKKMINVPFKQNYRTNILGEIFTGGNTFIVIVDPKFESPDYTVTEDPLAFAFETGGTYVLDENVSISRPLVISGDKELVLDLNGKSITASKDLWNQSEGIWSMISVQDGAKLKIIDETTYGTIEARLNDSYAIDVRGGGELSILGGNFVGNISTVYVVEGIANIQGGKFDLRQLSEYKDKRYMLNCLDANYTANPKKANIIVTGGLFDGFNPGDNLAEGPNTSFVPSGYSSDALGSDDVYKVRPVSE